MKDVTQIAMLLLQERLPQQRARRGLRHRRRRARRSSVSPLARAMASASARRPLARRKEGDFGQVAHHQRREDEARDRADNEHRPPAEVGRSSSARNAVATAPTW